MSDELVITKNNQLVTDSKNVAEHFGKRHKNIIQNIENLTSAENSANLDKINSMFYESTAPDKYGREQKMYYMNRDGFSLLVMGFTGKKALEWKLKYIEAFNAIEKKVNGFAKLPDFTNPVIAARAWADQLEARQKAEAQLVEMKPKAEFADAVSVSPSDITIGTLAKILKQNGVDIGRTRLYDWMRQNKYLVSNKKDWNMPRQEYVNCGYFRIRESTIDMEYGRSPAVRCTTYVTGKGQQYFVKMFMKGGKPIAVRS